MFKSIQERILLLLISDIKERPLMQIDGKDISKSDLYRWYTREEIENSFPRHNKDKLYFYLQGLVDKGYVFRIPHDDISPEHYGSNKVQYFKFKEDMRFFKYLEKFPANLFSLTAIIISIFALVISWLSYVS